MASGSVLRVRNEIEEKLSSKRLELEETLKEIKKYGGVMGKGKIHNRLGLAMGHGQADRRRVAILSRLGPKVTDEDADPCQQQPIVQEEIEEEEEEDDDEDAGPAAARLVSSRVVVEHKSRQQILNQQTSRNQEEMQRNKRIFNSLLFGHLAKFRKDETKVKEREQKKREVEKKIELRTELEKQEADKKKRQLAQEQRTKQQELKVLQVQMRRVEQFEEWEQNKKNQLHFIRTKTLLPLFFLPKEHNDATLTALEDTMDVVESEIRQARAKFEEDLLRIESRAKNVATGQNLESESEEDEDESKQQKYRSVIVVQHNQNLSDGAGHDEEIASDPHQRGSSPHDENQSLEDQPSAHHQFIRGDSSRDRTEDQEHSTSHHLSTDSRFSKRTNEHETMEREADDHPRQETNEQPPSPVQQTELAQENRKKLKRGHDALLESRNGNKAPYSEGAPAKNVTRESAAKRKRGQSSDRGRKTRSSSSSSSSSDSSSSSASSSSSSSSSSDSSDDEESRKKVKSGSSQRKMSSKAATSKRK